MPNHHFPIEHLCEYANGSISTPKALVVASHLSLCSECHHQYQALESIGGLMLNQLTQTPMSEGALQTLLCKLDDDCDEAAMKVPMEPDVVLPYPLHQQLGRSIRNLPWQHVTSYLSVFDVQLKDKCPETTRLMLIKAGHPMPRHTHSGEEITMVLAGSFSDESGFYERGDVAIADENIEHRPMAHPSSDCICIAVTEGPVRLTGTLGKLINPFFKF